MYCCVFFFSSRRRHTRCALVTGVQTCALPISEMLRRIGASSIEELFADVPEAARLSGEIAGLPNHSSEMSVERQMAALARRNMAASDVLFFLGAGAYRHHVPASVDHLIQRGGFLTD